MKLEPYQFYEHTLAGVETKLASDSKDGSVIIVRFEDRYTGKRKEVKFSECSNIIFEMDFDILLDNAPSNTAGSGSTDNPEDLIAFVKENENNWSVVDLDDPHSSINMKIEKVKNKTLHQISFFGGRLRVVCSFYEISESSI
ncbi:hypothetical protein ACJJIF_04755 [Microbulbifer sp. SSSA002]|uniref:hypothetical protein n=1 Tax=unclassified Microbulbifer TaxID=2619833 RepID=UPI004039690A